MPRLRCGRVWLTLLALGFCTVARPVTAAEAAPNTLSPAELAAGWILLFDGETTFGWQASSAADWKVDAGTITVGSGEKGLLATTSEFADYELKVDFKAAKGTNSAVFLRTPLQPKSPASDCYELNIAPPENPFPTGSFVQRQKATPVGESDTWRTFNVLAQGGKFRVELDGKLVLEYTDPKPIARGRIGLQFNEGAVAFRNVKLKPLSLAPLFNGKDLTGWKVYPEKKSLYSVTAAGELHVKDGPGSLESEAKFGDFVLQAEVFSNGKHLNSGIFFRSIPGEFTQGYECQVQNGYKDDDRTKPADFGTGAFYRRQPARKVVSNDFEWTYMTLIVNGPRMATWVNGIQVSDWEDTRKPDPNPRKGLRTEPGTLSIQGHDPTTDLSFRNLRASETPK